MKCCSKCGEELSDEMKFCGKCGTPQMEKLPKKKKRTRICLIILMLILMSGGIFLFFYYNIVFEKTSYNEDNIGEICFYQTGKEHVASDGTGIQYADNEILLVAKEGTSYKKIKRLAKSCNAEIVGWIEQTGDYQLRFVQDYSLERLEKIADKLEKKSYVQSAYVNYIFNLGSNKTKSRDGFIYGSKWDDDLQNFNDCEGKSWGSEAIETLAAWDMLERYSESVSSVRIGLVDNGFDTEHDDLGFAEIFYNINTKDHGTHVAGTMAAKTDNEQGICGVYPYGSGNLYGVSYDGICGYSENGSPFASSMFLKIAYAELILRNVKVINSSLGFNYREWPLENTGKDWENRVAFLESNAYILGDFLNRLLEKGYDFVLVSSAGNDSDRSNNVIYDGKYNFWTAVIDRKDYPKVYDRIIVVGAVDSEFKICNFSNGGDRVDIYAPGEEIFSTVSESKYTNKNWDGTSMAAPHVSGVAAMVWSMNNELTGNQVKEIVCRRGNLKCTSCKMVDAYVAMECAVRTRKEFTKFNPQNGSILCWVVDAGDEFTKIENALVTATNISTGKTETTTTDVFGHFELILPEGEYTLTVQAEDYREYIYPEKSIGVKNQSVNYLNDWIKMKKESLSEEELLEIMKTTTGKQIESYVYLDMDNDGTKEMIGVYTDAAGNYQVWYCNNDGTICQAVHYMSKSTKDACDLEVLKLDDMAQVAVNTYCFLGIDKTYSILALENEKITTIVSNEYGYVSMNDSGDICLQIEEYDGMYDPWLDTTNVRTWKDTYLYYDGQEYKEYGAKIISESEFLGYENAKTIKQEIEQRLIESDVLKIEYTYFARINGIMHIQCDIYRESGEIDFGYYTLNYSQNILSTDLGERNSGQMKTHFSSFEVIY